MLIEQYTVMKRQMFMLGGDCYSFIDPGIHQASPGKVRVGLEGVKACHSPVLHVGDVVTTYMGTDHCPRAFRAFINEIEGSVPMTIMSRVT